MNKTAASKLQASNPAEDTPFVQFWNEVLAEKFIRYKHIMVDGLSNHSASVFPRLPVSPGDNVLDVGCGFGDTALELAKRVGPHGQVTGIDCCDAFLAHAEQLANEHKQSNLKFVRGDAEATLSENEFDFIFARFGTMFFANPVNALRNIRKALKPGGRFVHIVWRDRNDNPWLSVARDVILRFVPAPDDGAASCGPGPFSMAGENHTRQLMEIAGFKKIEFTRVDAKVKIGDSITEAINFQLAIGPAGEVFREAGAAAEQQRDVIEQALADALKQHATFDNGFYMGSSSWMISAESD